MRLNRIYKVIKEKIGILIKSIKGEATPQPRGERNLKQKGHNPTEEKELAKLILMVFVFLPFGRPRLLPRQGLHLSNRHDPTLVHLVLEVEGIRCRRPP